MSNDDDSSEEVEATGLDIPEGHESRKGAFNDSKTNSEIRKSSDEDE